jgi:hypothetical protein
LIETSYDLQEVLEREGSHGHMEVMLKGTMLERHFSGKYLTTEALLMVRYDRLVKDVRKLANVLLLTEPDGIGEQSFGALRRVLMLAGGADILNGVDATDGRYYLPK